MPEKLAHLQDGTTLHFPDTFSDEEVVKRTQAYQNSRLTSSSSTPPVPPVPSIPQTPSEVVNKQMVAPNAPIINWTKTLEKNAPSKETLMSAGGGAVGFGLTGSPIIGEGVMVGLNQLLNPENYEKTPGQNILEMGKNFALNELLGGAFSAVGKVGREIYKPGSVLPHEMEELLPFKPTTSQLTGNKVLGLIENLSGHAKQAALETSNALVKDKTNALVQDTINNSGVDLNTPFKAREIIQKDIDQSYDLAKMESSKRGLAAKLIAAANPTTNARGQNINGFIGPTELASTAKALLDKIEKSYSTPDPASPLVNDLKNILRNTTDVAGNPVGQDFGTFWKSQQDFGDKGYPKLKKNITTESRAYQDIYNAMQTDMERSIPSWKTNGDVALRLMQESKAIAEKRHELFGQAPIDKLISDEKGNIPEIDRIISTPKDLKKAIISGNLQIPNDQGFNYITSNVRKDMAGYEIQQIANRAARPDGTIDGSKMLSQLLDPNKQESYLALFGSPKNSASMRSKLEDLYKNAAIVSQSPNSAGPSRYLMLRLTTSGLGLGGGLATSMISGHSPALLGAGGAIVGGTVALSSLGKLLSNPTTAKIVASATAGGPLNMSTQMAGRVLANVLRNTPMTLEYSDGNKIEGKLNAEGQFTVPVK